MKAVVMEEKYRSQDYYKIMQRIVPEMNETAIGSAIQSKSVPSLSHVIMATDKILP